ncbi:MAG: peptide deformylase [Cytophagales bacterium]|nr:peptide deformylase [Cytophagales bacterium]
MIYPIVAYGDPILRKKAAAIEEKANVKQLIVDMFETMGQAKGVGLAAPQIGKSIRLFVIDVSPFFNDAYKKVFINPLRIDESGELWKYEEGCLSIPDVRIDVTRKDKINISYFDEDWNKKKEEFTGVIARVIQHEYDHLEGMLHVDYASPLRKKSLKSELSAISNGKVEVAYKMSFPSS